LSWGSFAKQQEGAPRHVARMWVVDRASWFKQALRRAKRCAPLAHTCRRKIADNGRETFVACTWRTSRGTVVAATIGNPDWRGGPDYRYAAMWADRALLHGRCPK
jgi:hypothetical protein